MNNRLEIVVPKAADLKECAKVYASAYSVSPWNESYSEAEIEAYIASYLASSALCCYALRSEGIIVGLALGLIVPSIGGSYLRVEDFCVAASHQGKGYGSELMRLLMERVKVLECDDVLLGTQRGYPSHMFYLKNGFTEIESVLLYKAIRTG